MARTCKTPRYRSGFEKQIHANLKSRGVDVQYEPYKIGYIWPAESALYTPDFVLKNGIHIEAKGEFTARDRKKLLEVRRSNPDLDLRLVFMNGNNFLTPAKRKKSKKNGMTYTDWCEKNNFKYAEKIVPEEWINE